VRVQDDKAFLYFGFGSKLLRNRFDPRAMHPPIRQMPIKGVSKSAIKLKKRFWAKTWVIPLATALLTALLSGFTSAFVTIYNLSSEHSFTSRQKSEERQQMLRDEKMRLTSEAARLSGELLGIRLQYAMDTYLANSLSIVMMGKTGKTPIFSAEDLKSASADYDHAQDVEHEDFTRLYSIGAQTQSVFRISSIRFGSKTKEAIERLAPTTLPLGIRITPETSLVEEYRQFESQVKNEEDIGIPFTKSSTRWHPRWPVNLPLVRNEMCRPGSHDAMQDPDNKPSDWWKAEESE
jgi:hypothetical protein